MKKTIQRHWQHWSHKRYDENIGHTRDMTKTNNKQQQTEYNTIKEDNEYGRNNNGPPSTNLVYIRLY
jgi:hypothetical protein